MDKTLRDTKSTPKDDPLPLEALRLLASGLQEIAVRVPRPGEGGDPVSVLELSGRAASFLDKLALTLLGSAKQGERQIQAVMKELTKMPHLADLPRPPADEVVVNKQALMDLE